MSYYQILAAIAGFAFLYSLVASRLERTPISGALVYIVFGLFCGPHFLGLLEMEVDGEGIKRLAEFTLAVVLFSDSAGANLSVLRRVEQLPIRLLLIGLPLTIALGFGAGYLVFDGMSLFAIALLATMLAPTDAALGKAVVANENVPDGVRQGLNVESGLNDGICVPVLLIFLALTTTTVDGAETAGMVFRLPLQEIGIGALVGLSLAVLGGMAIRRCSKRGWITGSWVQLPVIALALLCFGLAQRLDGSGFIASFIGGLVFGGLTHEHKEEVLRGAEGTGDAVSLITWFTFGAVVIGPQISNLTWRVAVYAVLSLTVVRMLPVMLCLAGTKQQLDTRLFLGWFGPRGLASVVFAVMVAAENEPLIATVTWTVVLSIVAHGLSANPLARIYGDRVKNRGGVT
jgi:NhaP-type Na+/H+ or K+/H+ antiporter